ncbi:MAG: transposase [Terriglobia bacterium]
MPDHWHGLRWPTGTLTISRVMQEIKCVSARRINRSRRTRSSLWQQQFWDRFVRHGRELSQRLEYLHMNLVRKGLVVKPEEWRWSRKAHDEKKRSSWLPAFGGSWMEPPKVSVQNEAMSGTFWPSEMPSRKLRPACKLFTNIRRRQ